MFCSNGYWVTWFSQDIPSGDAVDAVDAVDCEIVEECVDFDLYGGVKGEVLDDPQQQPIDMEQGNQQVGVSKNGGWGPQGPQGPQLFATFMVEIGKMMIYQ